MKTPPMNKERIGYKEVSSPKECNETPGSYYSYGGMVYVGEPSKEAKEQLLNLPGVRRSKNGKS